MWNQTWPVVGSAMPPLPTQTMSAQPPLPAAPPPVEPTANPPAAAVMPTPIAPTAMTNPYGQYTPAQYAALTAEQQYALQQHWQQWQVYQQEYAKWHAQYGEQYNREMAAAAAVYQPPPLPAQPPPLPPAAPPPDALPETSAPQPKPPDAPAKSAVKITAAATMYNNSAQPAAQNPTQQGNNSSPWFAASNRVDYAQPQPNRNQQSNNSWSQNNAQQNKFMNTIVRNSENFGNNQNPTARNNFPNQPTNNDNNWNQGGRNNRMMGNNNVKDFGNEGRFGGGFNADNQRNNPGWGRNGPGGPNQNQNQNNNNQWQGKNTVGQNRWGNNNNNNNQSNNNMRNFDGNQDDNVNRNNSNFNQTPLDRGRIDRSGGNFNRGPNERGGGYNQGPNQRGGYNNPNERSGGFNMGPNERDEGSNQGPNERGGMFNMGRNQRGGPGGGGGYNHSSNERGGSFNMGTNERDNDSHSALNERGGAGGFNQGPHQRGAGGYNNNTNERDEERGGGFNRSSKERDEGPNEKQTCVPGPNARGMPSNPGQQAKPDMTEEIFDRQFRAWEDTFEDWKVTNANNPDRDWYNRMLQQFETQRKILIEKRNQIRQRRMAQMGGQPSPQKNAIPQKDVIEDPTTKQLDTSENSQQIETKNCRTESENVDENHYDGDVNKNETEAESEAHGNEEETAVDEENLNEEEEVEAAAAEILEMSQSEISNDERKRKMSFADDEGTKHKSLRTEEDEDENIITINLDDDEVIEERNKKMTDLFGRSEGIPGLDLVEGGNSLENNADENKKNEEEPEKANKMPEVKPIETGKEQQRPLEVNVEEPKKNLTQQIQESSVGNLPIVINALQDPDMLKNIIQVLAKIQGSNQQEGSNPLQGPTEQVLQQLPGLLQKLHDQRQNVPGNQGGMPFRDYQQEQHQHHQQQQHQQQFVGGRPPNFFGPNNPQMNFGPNQFGGNFNQMPGPGNGPRPQNNFGPMGGPPGNFQRNFGFGGPGGPRNNMGQNFNCNQPQNFMGNANNFQDRRGGPNAPNFDRPAGGPNFNMQRGGGPLDGGNNFARNRQQNQNKSNPFRRNNPPRGGGPQSGNQWTGPNNSADGGGSFADDEYFEPVKVIDYQNTSTVAKVFEYSRRMQPDKMHDTSRRAIPDDYQPVKTFDYGHASGAMPFGRRRADSANSGGSGHGGAAGGIRGNFGVGGGAGNNRNNAQGPQAGPPNRISKNTKKNRKNRNKKNKNKQQQQQQPQQQQQQQQVNNEENKNTTENNTETTTVQNAVNENVQNPAMDDTKAEMSTKNMEEPLNNDSNVDHQEQQEEEEEEEQHTTKEDFEEISENEEDLAPEQEQEQHSPAPPPPPLFSMGVMPTKPAPVFPAATTNAPTSMVANKIQMFYPSSENNNTITIDEILLSPGRLSRPKKICIIFRGPPGSGKSYVAKLIKDKEQEMGGNSIRILSIDDYFLIENDYEEKCPKTGKNLKKKEILYEYDAENEPTYMQYLIKAFKKTIADNLYDIIIVDCNNNSLRTLNEFYCPAKDNGFMAYIVDMFCDLDVCLSRNVHERSEKDIREIIDTWKPTPFHYIKLDVSSLLENVVEMEDAENMATDDVESVVDLANEASEAEESQHSSNTKETVAETADEEDSQGSDKTCGFLKSKWESEENQMEQLARLDGTRKVIKKNTTMEDYLQLDDWMPIAVNTNGKKRVRWADIEEKRKQQKMRDIGFVVGQTDWRRMMDPQAGNRALNQTKYFRKNK